MSELNLFQNFFSRKAKSSIEEDASLASSESTRTLMEGEPFVDSVTFQEPMPASPAGVEPMQRDALLGTDVKDSSEVLSRSVRALKAGDEQMRIEAVPAEAQVGTALRTISRQSSDLLEIAETVSSLKLQQHASPTEISAADQLVMLTQRIGKSANEFLTMEGVNPEAVFLLGKAVRYGRYGFD